MIRLSEPFHCVVQGEGLNIGKKMVVVRVKGCPVLCPQCDSQHTWEGDSISYEVLDFYKELKKQLKKYKCNHVMVTGGEPGLYVSFFKELFDTYSSKIEDWKFDFETAGVIDLSSLYEYEYQIQFNFSPKIGSLAPEKTLELKAFEGKELPDFYSIKVVVSKATWDTDLLAIKQFQEKYKIEDSSIYLMPKGTDKATIIRESKWLIKKLSKMTYNFTTRLHILLYNKKKLV